MASWHDEQDGRRKLPQLGTRRKLPQLGTPFPTLAFLLIVLLAIVERLA